MPRMFRLFRALGLRHLLVINDTNEVSIINNFIRKNNVIISLGNWYGNQKRFS